MPLTGGVTEYGSGGLLGALAGGVGNILQQAIPTIGQIGLNALANGYNPPTYTGGAVLGETQPPQVYYPGGSFQVGGGSIKMAIPSPAIPPYQPQQPGMPAPLSPLQPQAFQSMSPIQPVSYPQAPLIREGVPSTYQVPMSEYRSNQPPPVTPADLRALESAAHPQPSRGPAPDPTLDAPFQYDLKYGRGAYERDHGMPDPAHVQDSDRIQLRPQQQQAPVVINPGQPAAQPQPEATPAPVNSSTLPQSIPSKEETAQKTKEDFDKRYGPGAYDKLNNNPQAQQPQGKGFHLPHIPGLGGLGNRLGQGLHNAAMAASPGYRQQKLAEAAGRGAFELEKFKQGAELTKSMAIEEFKAQAEAMKQAGMNLTQIQKAAMDGAIELQKAAMGQKLNAYQQHQVLEDFLKIPTDTPEGQQNRAAAIMQNPWLADYQNIAQDPKAAAELGKAKADAGIAALEEAKKTYSIYDEIMKGFYDTRAAERKDQIDGATVQADIRKKVSESASASAKAQVDAATVASDIGKSINDSAKSGYDMYKAGVDAQWAQPNAQQQYAGRAIGQAAAVNDIGLNAPILNDAQVVEMLKQRGVPVDQVPPEQLKQMVQQFKFQAGPGLQMQAQDQARRALQGGVQQGFQLPPPPSMQQMQQPGVPVNMPQGQPQPGFVPPPPPGGMIPANMLNMYPPQMNQPQMQQMQVPPPPGMPQGMPMAQAPQMQQPQQLQGGVQQQAYYPPGIGLGLTKTDYRAPQSAQPNARDALAEFEQQAQRLLAEGVVHAPRQSPLDFLTGRADDNAYSPDQIASKQEFERIEQEWAAKETEAKAKEEQKYLARIDTFMTPQSRGQRNGAPLTDPDLAMKFVSAADQSVKRFEQLMKAAGWSGFKNTGAAQPLLPQFAQVQKEMNPMYQGEAPFPAGQLPPGAQRQQIAQPPFPYGKLPPAMMGR